MRLMAGWDCIEVFPGLKSDNVGSAICLRCGPRTTILSAVLIAHSKTPTYYSSTQEPAARRQYAELLRAFKALLDANPEREQAFTAFCKLTQCSCAPLIPCVVEGCRSDRRLQDFVFRDAAGEYMLVELERSTLGLFRQDGHPNCRIGPMHRVKFPGLEGVTWRTTYATYKTNLGFVGITANPHGDSLFIGRFDRPGSSGTTQAPGYGKRSPKLRVLTYDDVY